MLSFQLAIGSPPTGTSVASRQRSTSLLALGPLHGHLVLRVAHTCLLPLLLLSFGSLIGHMLRHGGGPLSMGYNPTRNYWTYSPSTDLVAGKTRRTGPGPGWCRSRGVSQRLGYLRLPSIPLAALVRMCNPITRATTKSRAFASSILMSDRHCLESIRGPSLQLDDPSSCQRSPYPRCVH